MCYKKAIELSSKETLQAACLEAYEALESAEEKFMRISWVVLPGTMEEARALDGWKDAEEAIEKLNVLLGTD